MDAVKAGTVDRGSRNPRADRQPFPRSDESAAQSGKGRERGTGTEDRSGRGEEKRAANEAKRHDSV